MDQPETFSAPSAPSLDINQQMKEAREDIHAILDACKELIKITGDLVKQVELLRKAGKF